VLQTDEPETPLQHPPKNQQNWRAARLGPYLEIANLFPLERKFPPLPRSIRAGSKVAQAVIEVAEASGQRKVWDRLATRVSGSNRVTADHRIKLHPMALALGPIALMAFDQEDRLKAGSDLELFRDLYELFLAVRQMLRATQWMKTTGGASSFERISIPTVEVLSYDSRTQRYSVKPWPVFEGFKTALNDLEDDRLRRCPVCQGFFYAVRANTQACEAHRVLARVRKNRGIPPATPERRTIQKVRKAEGRSSIIAATPEQGTAPARKRRASRK